MANQTTIPRVLFKHGKRSKEFIQSVSRASSNTVTNPHPAQIQQNCSSDCGSFSDSHHVPSSQPSPAATTLPVSSQSQLPTSSAVSSIISREINSLKDDLYLIKTDIASLKRQPSISLPNLLQAELGHEIKNLKDELDKIRKLISNNTVTEMVSPHSYTQPITHMNQIHVSLSLHGTVGVS